jgi:hypothetical protein
MYMFDFLIAIILGFGVGGWLYFKLNRNVGDANGASHLLSGMAVGVVLTLIIFTLLKFILNVS